MPTLDEAIEDVKKKYGFSNEAWNIFQATVNQIAELEHKIDQLTQRVRALERRPSQPQSHDQGQDA